MDSNQFYSVIQPGNKFLHSHAWLEHRSDSSEQKAPFTQKLGAGREAWSCLERVPLLDSRTRPHPHPTGLKRYLSQLTLIHTQSLEKHASETKTTWKTSFPLVWEISFSAISKWNLNSIVLFHHKKYFSEAQKVECADSTAKPTLSVPETTFLSALLSEQSQSVRDSNQQPERTVWDLS